MPRLAGLDLSAANALVARLVLPSLARCTNSWLTQGNNWGQMQAWITVTVYHEMPGRRMSPD